MTPAEKQAVEADIRAGIKQVVELLKGVERSLPIAISHLNPHATSTRKVLAAAGDLLTARRAFEHVLAIGVVIKPEQKK